MSAIRRRLFGRWRRGGLVAAAVGVVWIAWWFWPPQSEVAVRLTGASNNSCDIAPDGRTLLLLKPDKSAPPDSWPGWQTAIHDLPSGRAISSLPCRNEGGTRLFSPDGHRLAVLDGRARWSFFSLRPFELMSAFTTNESAYRGYWAPDSEHFVALDYPDYSIVQATGNKAVARVEGLPPVFTEDCSGFVALSADRCSVEYWSLRPLGRVDSFQLSRRHAPSMQTYFVRPDAETMNVWEVAVSANGDVVAALVVRYDAEGDGLTATRYVEWWDRRTGRHGEAEAGSFSRLHECTLGLDVTGRYVCLDITIGAYVYPDEPKWLVARKTPPAERRLWDTTDMGRDILQPQESAVVAPAGRTFLLQHDRRSSLTPLTFSGVVDAETMLRKVLPSMARLNGFSPDGRFAAKQDFSGPPTWLPAWTPKPVVGFLTPGPTVSVVHLADCFATQRIPGQSFSEITHRNELWTSRTVASDQVFERWPCEAPGPPWWLWLLTAVGLVTIVYKRGQNYGLT